MPDKNPVAAFRSGEEKGFTILEVLIGLAVLGVVSTGIFQAYGSVLEIVQSAQYNSAALAITEAQVETVRNMRYEDVGTVGGVPAGKLPQSQQITLDGVPYTLESYVRNIDDPFDGTLGGSPGDTAPADYKLVEFHVVCNSCTRYKLTSMATYVAPKNLESASKNGNLFIRVLDASGQPVVGATVHVTNTKVSPAINLTDITGSNGMLQLVDTATSSAAYHIVVSKTGYNGDQTYPPGTPPNPTKPDATVASQQLTISTLAIDRTSTLRVTARNQFCAPAPGMDFLVTGSKLIATSPDVPKYSQSQITNASGILDLATLEWDTYTLKPTDTAWDIAGVIATSSLTRTVDPNTNHAIVWQAASHSLNALLVSVADGAGALQDDATVQVTGPGGYNRTLVTGRAYITQSDWSGGQYASKSSQLNANTALTMTGGLLGGEEWLESKTFDLGTSSVTFYELNWTETLQLPLTDAKFQLAGNNGGTTWNFVGPDGTAGSYYTSPGQTISSAMNGNRYIRYKAYLSSGAVALTPIVDDVSIGFRSGCIISGQAYFNGMTTGTYTVTITKSGFQNSTTTKAVVDPWQRHTVTLIP